MIVPRGHPRGGDLLAGLRFRGAAVPQHLGGRLLHLEWDSSGSFIVVVR